jgi:hypothetical protein
MRTQRTSVTFRHPFALHGVDRTLPAGTYLVVTDEEMIEGISFPVYRRLATMIHVPTQSRTAVEALTIDPRDLASAQERDARTDGLTNPVPPQAP